MSFQLIEADCITAMAAMEEASVDAIVTDPPYGLEFMGKEWDNLRPEYGNWNDAKWAGKGMTQKQGAATAGRPSGVGSLAGATPILTQKKNLRCRTCGHWQAGGSPCRCEHPDWEPRADQRAQAMQAWHQAWATEALRVLKPGGHLLAMGGSRTIHRLVCAIEDAGFEIRDMLCWIYGQGFPKSLNLDGEWAGWGTALKPAWEGITLARKPLIGSVAQNVTTFGTGALNIDGTRIDPGSEVPGGGGWKAHQVEATEAWDRPYTNGVEPTSPHSSGRWPPNVLLDEEAAAMLDEQSGETSYNPAGQFGTAKRNAGHLYGGGAGLPHAGQPVRGFGDRGGASRFFTVVEPARCPTCGGRWVGDPEGTGEPCSDPFHANNPNFPTRFRYLPKADREERNRGLLPGERSSHPTVKPVELMQWLVRLITPPKGLVLDPFTGSGSTLIAACREGFDCIGIEREPEYVAIARDRIIGDGPLFNMEVPTDG